MENLITYKNYQQFKKILDAVMIRAVEDFVIIGYLLNEAATTDILLESGYANVNEFAKAEYDIDESQVSRFIRIHKRFGVPGEPKLKDQYSNHGVKKLGIMLTLPDFLNEEISKGYSYTEINAIKHEYEAEKQVSDIEVAIERKDMENSIQYSLPEGLKQAVYQLIHDEPELYVRIYSAIELDDLKEILTPMGEQSYFVRIKGVGKLAIFMRANADISISSLRDGSKENYDWQQFFDVLKEYFAMGENAKDSWSNVFQEPYPEEVKEEPVKAEPSKPAKPNKNNVQQSKPKKKSKVKVVETKPKKEPKPEPKVEEKKEPEEQLPGQMDIMQYPDYLPESMKEDKPEVITGEVEDIIPEKTEEPQKDKVQQDSEGMKVEHFAPVQQTREEKIKECKVKFEGLIDELDFQFSNEEWGKAYAAATAIVWEIKKIQELEGKN